MADRGGWHRLAVFSGVTFTGLAGAWVITWGAQIAADDGDLSFWNGVTSVAIVAFVVGVALVALGELKPATPKLRLRVEPRKPRSVRLLDDLMTHYSADGNIMELEVH